MFFVFFPQGKPVSCSKSHAVCPDKSSELMEFLYNLAGTVFLYCCVFFTLFMDHSWRDGSQWVMMSKARLGTALTRGHS